MIHFAFNHVDVRNSPHGWLVEHPHNGAILAYCDTKDEAEQVARTLLALIESFGNAVMDGRP